MALEYTDKVIEHFRHPRNVGVIKNPDGVGKVTSSICGDLMELYIKVKNDRIADVKFQTFGCAAAVASSSILTEMIKGKKVDEILKITNKRITEALGGLPKEKLHCSVLAEDAVKSAIEDYQKKSKFQIPKSKCQIKPKIQNLKRIKISKDLSIFGSFNL